MKKLMSLLSLLAVIVSAMPAYAAPIHFNGTIDTYFSPRGGAIEAIVAEIRAARSEILVQAYSFTSPQIAKALVDAHKRGVTVDVVLDKSQRSERYTSADFVAHAGIPVFIDSTHAIAHNKIIIVDRKTLITGSFNFTKAAEEKNAENLLILKGNGAELVNTYVANYNKHRQHSEPYTGKGQ